MTTATLRLVGHNLPGTACLGHHNVHLGVQRRRDVVDLVSAAADAAVFHMPLEAVTDRFGPDFRGPFTHGTRGQRFIYLSWCELADDGTFTMFRRAKLHLSTLPDHIAAALADGATVQADLDLTDPTGGPICASIPDAKIAWSIDGAVTGQRD